MSNKQETYLPTASNPGLAASADWCSFSPTTFPPSTTAPTRGLEASRTFAMVSDSCICVRPFFACDHPDVKNPLATLSPLARLSVGMTFWLLLCCRREAKERGRGGVRTERCQTDRSLPRGISPCWGRGMGNEGGGDGVVRMIGYGSPLQFAVLSSKTHVCL